MNKYHNPNDTDSLWGAINHLPKWAFAQSSSAHWLRPGLSAEVNFDLLGAQQIIKSSNPTDSERVLPDALFDLLHPERLAQTWIDWNLGERTLDPYANIPIGKVQFRIDLTNADIFGPKIRKSIEDRNLDNLEAELNQKWFAVALTRYGRKPTPNALERQFIRPARDSVYSSRARFFTNISDEGSNVRFWIFRPSLRCARGLRTLSTTRIGNPLTPGIFRQLIKDRSADYLAVFDVGQGNASALCSGTATNHKVHLTPSVYVDVGQPIPQKKKTLVASGINLCFDARPLVILTHYHEDHYSGHSYPHPHGAYATPAIKTGIDCDWIVPDSTMAKPIARALLTSILAAKSKVFNFLKGSKPYTAYVQRNISIELSLGLGTKNPNHSGIVVVVYNFKHDATWLLPGDCDYAYFDPVIFKKSIHLLLVPHHGSKYKQLTVKNNNLHMGPPQRPQAPGLKVTKLVYSFGHPITKHPNLASWNSLANFGWTLPSNFGTAGGDVMVTRIPGPGTAPGQRGVAIPWVRNPKLNYEHQRCGNCPVIGCDCRLDMTA